MSRLEMKPAHATGAREKTSGGLRATAVKGTDGIRTMMLPSSPVEVVAILAERRAKKTPANRTRARLVAEAKKRGL